MNKYYLFFVALTITVLGIVITGFAILQGTYSTRDLNFDSTRHSHFDSIKTSVEYYAQRYYRLPATLAEANITYYKDPQTNGDYTYTVTGPTTYKICTTFSTDTYKISSEEKYDTYSREHLHKKGFDCIAYSVNLGYSYRISPTAAPTPTPAGIHRDGSSYCENHGGIALTIPYDIVRGDWQSCLAWCDTQMTKALPLCQYNSDGPRNCWINYPPGGKNGDVKDCQWTAGAPPYGAWWKGLETGTTRSRTQD